MGVRAFVKLVTPEMRVKSLHLKGGKFYAAGFPPLMLEGIFTIQPE